MSRVILQPTSNPIALDHYRNTIENPVLISIMEPYITEELKKQILSIYPDGKVYVWGVTNGVNDTNKRKWENISRGDVTLFSRKGGVFSRAVTTLTFHNKELAAALWEYDENGNTWENIYLVDEIENLYLPYKKLNPVLGYKDSYIIQGFNVLSEDLSEKAFLAFDLFSDTFYEKVSEQEYENALNSETHEDDIIILAENNDRKKHFFLRNYIFGGKTTAKCGICGKELPVNMLTCSHIKKRKECSREDLLDYKNIVMPMCRFGCADLYEKGYIYVNDGIVKINKKKKITYDMTKTLDLVDGKTCLYWNEESKKYFDAHMKKQNLYED